MRYHNGIRTNLYIVPRWSIVKIRSFVVLSMMPACVWASSIVDSFEIPTIQSSIQNDTLYFHGTQLKSTPGSYVLPVIRRRILLPSSVVENSIKVTVKTNKSNIKYEDVAVVVNSADYDGNGPLSFERDGSSNNYTLRYYRNFPFVELNLSPFQYDSLTNSISSYDSVNVSVEYELLSQRSLYYPHSKEITKITTLVDNSELLDEFSTRYRSEHLVIVTTESAKNSLAQLDAFIQSKESRGFTVSVVTEDIWGGGTGVTAADNLHQWVRDNYLAMGIDYILIIGDPSPETGDIPMKTAHAYYSGKKAATDFYYSDVTGNWDIDGDGKFGELDDLSTKKAGGIDAIPDIVVGRIPLYDKKYADVDHILEKTIAYETESAEEVQWRENMMLIMDGYYGGEGYEVGEAIYDDLSGTSWDFYRMYSRNVNGCDDFSITEQEVTDEWKTGAYGVVSWLTHGKETAAMHIMNNEYAQELSDSSPSFVLMGSCLNGKPDVKNNLAYTILLNGAVGVVAGSETTIFKQPMGNFQGSSYNHGFIHGFTTILAKDKPFVGDALSIVKEQADMGCWKNYCAFNLYGDPTLGLDVYGVEQAVSAEYSEKINTQFSISKAENSLILHGISGKASINIYSVSGRKLYSIAKNNFENGAVVELPSLAKSLYVVNISHNNKEINRQFLLGK